MEVSKSHSILGITVNVNLNRYAPVNSAGILNEVVFAVQPRLLHVIPLEGFVYVLNPKSTGIS